MNVVIAGHLTFPSGGAPTARIRNFALGLRENGAQVHVLALAPEFNMSAAEGRNIHQYQGITYERLACVGAKRSSSTASRLRWFTALYGSALPAYRRLQTLVAQNQCDVFLSYGRNAVLQWGLVKLCKQHRIPTILDVTEVVECFGGTGGKLNPLYWDWYLGAQFMPRDFDIVTTITHVLKQKHQAMGCKQVMVIPSIEGWDNLPSPPPRAGDVFRLVYVGAMIDRDAPDILIEALRLLHARGIPVQLDVIGRYQYAAQGRKRVETIQADPTLSKCVTLIGEVSDQELTERMRFADGLVLLRRDSPAEVAAFPTRLVEYLRQGKPVFVSDVGDVRLYLRDGQDAVLLSPNDASQIADAVACIAARSDRGAMLGIQGQRRGSECFNRRTYAQQLIEAVRALESAVDV